MNYVTLRQAFIVECVTSVSSGRVTSNFLKDEAGVTHYDSLTRVVAKLATLQTKTQEPITALIRRVQLQDYKYKLSD